MFWLGRKGSHRAPRGCRNHVSDLETSKADIRLLSAMIERLQSEKETLEAEVRRLRIELGTDAPTEVLSVAQIRAQMRRTAPDVVKVVTPEGSTMLLPVGNDRTRHGWRPPKWAVQG